MKARILLLLAIILVLVMASGAPVAAGGAVVPFKARYQTYPVGVVYDPNTQIQTAEIPGDGVATHLGNTTFDSDSWIDLSQGPPYHQWCIAVFTAANGDQLYGTLDGTANIGHGDGTFQITGGSGRFEGVTGAGVYWFWLDADGWHCHFDGMLTK
jgi:hypothetical protein